MSALGQHPSFALFALAGFGNRILRSLWTAGLFPQFVVTRKEPGPFPYYTEEPLPELAGRLGVPCLFDSEAEAALLKTPLDALITATYHRILRRPLLSRVAWAVNLHPSLLPRYRGPNPFHWVIRNGECRTGVTAHLLIDEPDAGAVLWAEAIDIGSDETQGSLRFRLADVAARGAIAVMADIASGRVNPRPQDERTATAFGRPSAADRVWRDDWTVAEADRRMRAFAPFPGVPFDGRLAIGVESVAPPSPVPPGTVIARDGQSCRVRLADGDIVIRLA